MAHRRRNDHGPVAPPGLPKRYLFGGFILAVLVLTLLMKGISKEKPMSRFKRQGVKLEHVRHVEDAPVTDAVRAPATHAAAATPAPRFTTRRGAPATRSSGEGKVLPIVILTFNRPKYLARVMEAIDKAVKPDGWTFPIIFCQDGDESSVAKWVRTNYVDVGRGLLFQNMPRPKYVPGTTALFYEMPRPSLKGFFYQTQNFKFAFTKVFDELGYESAIFLEDDIEVGVDFLELFTALEPRLQRDTSLMCVCGYSENGISGAVSDLQALHRTSYFPGWGWMITRTLWEEFRAKWPLAFWDDWLREPEARRERDCIYPEISRTRHFGKSGVSNGANFAVIERIRVVQEKEFVKFSQLNLTYLDEYEAHVKRQVEAATLLVKRPTIPFAQWMQSVHESVKLTYNSEAEYKTLASWVGVIGEFKAHHPRNSYHGIVEFNLESNHRLFLIPK